MVSDLIAVHSPPARRHSLIIEKGSWPHLEIKLDWVHVANELTFTQKRRRDSFKDLGIRFLLFCHKPVSSLLNVVLVVFESAGTVWNLEEAREGLVHLHDQRLF